MLSTALATSSPIDYLRWLNIPVDFLRSVGLPEWCGLEFCFLLSKALRFNEFISIVVLYLRG